MRFVDSHVHLADYGGEIPASPSETLLLAAGTDQATSKRCLELAAADPSKTRAFVGLHPSEALKAESLGWLSGMVREATGIGEIGLDPKYSPTSAGDSQRSLFDLQLDLAESTRLPLQVHTRGAERLCLDLLSTRSLGRVLLHWFDGGELATTAAERGYFVSVGPALLYSKRIARLAERYPADLLLTESDGPVAFGALGGVSGPSLIPSVVFRLAEVKKVGFEDEADALLQNSYTYLQTASKG